MHVHLRDMYLSELCKPPLLKRSCFIVFFLFDKCLDKIASNYNMDFIFSRYVSNQVLEPLAVHCTWTKRDNPWKCYGLLLSINDDNNILYLYKIAQLKYTTTSRCGSEDIVIYGYKIESRYIKLETITEMYM